jgi:hypothetical protein
LTGLALTHTVAKGTIQGLFTSGKPFMRTPKFEQQSALFVGLVTIRQELFLLILLSIAIGMMGSLEHFDNFSGKLWIAILSVQAVPYLAALLTVLVSIAPDYKTKPVVEKPVAKSKSKKKK